MKDLSVLTPPFLMAAVVVVGVVAFLRHEMGRGRADRVDPDDISAPDADHEQDSKPEGDRGARRGTLT